MNDLQDLMDTMIMPAALPVLREACVMPALVATDFSVDTKEQFETIRVPLPQDLGDADDMDEENGSSSTALSDEKVDITLKSWKYKEFSMNDREMRESVTSGILPSAAESAIKSLANAVDKDLWALYKDIPYFAGAAGDTPDEKTDIVAVRKVLQDNLCPHLDRRLVLNTDAEAEFLVLFSDVDKTGSTEALLEASMGRKFGFDTFSDQLAPLHTTGTFAEPVVNGAVAAGATAMAVDGGAGTETLKAGDVFTVEGAVDSLGRSLQFVVLANVAAVGGAIGSVEFYPAAPAGGFANDAAITLIKPDAATQYAVNLAFHRDAFMFAARALATEQSENSTISVAADPMTGIPLRLETWREPKKAKRFWRFDILYGVKTLRRELAARLHG